MGRAPASWRLRPLLLALLLLFGAAERLHNEAGARHAGAGRRPSPRRAVRAATTAALLGAAGRGVAGASWLDAMGPHSELFAGTDSNGDRKLSAAEFFRSAGGDNGDASGQVELMSVFAQADIDGDDLLSEDEFLFARHIAGEVAEQEFLKLVADRLPPDYPQRIDKMIAGLRDIARGALSFDEYLVAMGGLLRIPISKLDPEAREKVKDLFKTADVTSDSLLNNNELDFLHYLVRDALVDAALEADRIAQDPDRLAQFQLQGFLEKFDLDGDGKLAKSEVLDALALVLAEANPEKDLLDIRGEIANLFESADADGDEVLDLKEVGQFISLFTSR